MEISMIRTSQVNLGRNGDVGLFNFGSAKICNFNFKNSKRCYFVHLKIKKSGVDSTLRASSSVRSEAAVNSERGSRIARTKRIDGVKLFVGLPLDTVTRSNTIKHGRAIAAGLKALKLLGVDGVELPVWWGVAEKEAMGKYEWSSYLAIVEMVQKLGLKLHVSFCFHASDECKIRLPDWVSRIGEQEPGVYFADRSGDAYKGCLSFAADDLPVLDGKTPVQVYTEFCENFKSAFAQFLGSTITGISVSLGPEGELRSNATQGKGGSWETPYKNQLISHGDRMLSLASSTFKNSPVTVSGKVPNTYGYQDIAQIFSKTSCKMILPVESCSSPGWEITEHGVDVSGERVGGSVGLDQLKKKLMDENSMVDLLTYQRLGACFFNPEHFSAFAQFVRGLNRPISRLGNVQMGDGREVESLSGSNHHMRTA